MENGVPIIDEKGNEVGTSKIAAKQGVMKTIISRNFGLPIPIIILPPLIMNTMVPKNLPKKQLLACELILITLCIASALPAAIALYPQKLEFDVKSLEEEFHDIKDKNGNKITTVYANKGI